MEIYIDESGSFACLSNPKLGSIACVVAIIIPDSKKISLFNAITTWKKKHNFIKELKGSFLMEPEFVSLISIMSAHDVIMEVTCTDMGLMTSHAVERHKTTVAENIIKKINDYHPMMQKDLINLNKQLMSLPNNLYVQFNLQNLLILKVLQIATLYHVVRNPKELGHFHWIIDRKGDKKNTAYEDLWSLFIMPYLEQKFAKKPLLTLEGADYSSFQYFCDQYDAAPEHLRQFNHEDTQPFHFVDIRKVLGNCLSFRDSFNNLGLQLADVAANCLRRAMKGNLQEWGWKPLAKLVIHRNESPVTMITLGNIAGEFKYSSSDISYENVLLYFKEHGKNMRLVQNA